jgi:hypothetical protein
MSDVLGIAYGVSPSSNMSGVALSLMPAMSWKAIQRGVAGLLAAGGLAVS